MAWNFEFQLSSLRQVRLLLDRFSDRNIRFHNVQDYSKFSNVLITANLLLMTDLSYPNEGN